MWFSCAALHLSDISKLKGVLLVNVYLLISYCVVSIEHRE